VDGCIIRTAITATIGDAGELAERNLFWGVGEHADKIPRFDLDG
jgi:hypothetical protein